MTLALATHSSGSLLEALPSAQAHAREAQQDDVGALQSGDSSLAEVLVGGGPQVLAEMNPEIPAADAAARLQAACRHNGLHFQLLRRIAREREIVPGFYRFGVEFNNADSRLFVCGPCCGASQTETLMQSVFAQDVVRSGEGFRVQQLPVHVA